MYDSYMYMYLSLLLSLVFTCLYPGSIIMENVAHRNLNNISRANLIIILV